MRIMQKFSKTKECRTKKCLERFFIILALLALQAGILNAQTVSRVGTTAAGFLKIGVGARALGMGEASATQAEDVTSLYWNPAGLAQIDNTQILFNHYDYIADIYYDYGGVAMSFGSFGTVGLHFGFLGMPDIERTTINEPEGTGEMVSASSFTAGLSYARKLTDRFHMGGTVKMIHESLWHTSATGFAVDLGLTYRTIFKNMKIGMSISNFGTSMQLKGRDLLVQHDIDPISAGNNSNINADLKTDKFSLPILFRVGLSSNITQDVFGIENNDLVFAVDAVHPNDNYEYMNAGVEYTYRKLLSLRGGYRQLFLEDSEGGLTLGFGLNLKLFSYSFIMDYAAVDYGRLDQLNKFSLILSL